MTSLHGPTLAASNNRSSELLGTAYLVRAGTAAGPSLRWGRSRCDQLDEKGRPCRRPCEWRPQNPRPPGLACSLARWSRTTAQPRRDLGSSKICFNERPQFSIRMFCTGETRHFRWSPFITMAKQVSHSRIEIPARVEASLFPKRILLSDNELERKTLANGMLAAFS